MRNHVLVVGIDGLRWDRVVAARAPHLLALRGAGAFAASQLDLSSGAGTWSGPGWATIATGVWPDKHGVLDNEFAVTHFDQWPDFLSRTSETLSTAVALDWPPLHERGVFGAAIGARILGDGESAGYYPEDDRVTDALADQLRSASIDASFIYLGSVDIVGHVLGALDEEYLVAIRHADACLGRLLAAIDARATRPQERWLVVVTTDHGHLDPGGHGGDSEVERGVFVLLAGDGIAAGSPLTATLVDIAPTVLTWLGLAIPPGLDGNSVLPTEG